MFSASANILENNSILVLSVGIGVLYDTECSDIVIHLTVC